MAIAKHHVESPAVPPLLFFLAAFTTSLLAWKRPTGPIHVDHRRTGQIIERAIPSRDDHGVTSSDHLNGIDDPGLFARLNVLRPYWRILYPPTSQAKFAKNLRQPACASEGIVAVTSNKSCGI